MGDGVGAELQAAVIKIISANSFQRRLRHHPSSTRSCGPRGRVSPALEWEGLCECFSGHHMASGKFSHMHLPEPQELFLLGSLCAAS